MSFPKTFKAPSAKGQFKCFKCRARISAKDGGWRQEEDQQVFLCKVCIVPSHLAAKAARTGNFVGLRAS